MFQVLRHKIVAKGLLRVQRLPQIFMQQRLQRPWRPQIKEEVVLLFLLDFSQTRWQVFPLKSPCFAMARQERLELEERFHGLGADTLALSPSLISSDGFNLPKAKSGFSCRFEYFKPSLCLGTCWKRFLGSREFACGKQSLILLQKKCVVLTRSSSVWVPKRWDFRFDQTVLLYTELALLVLYSNKGRG